MDIVAIKVRAEVVNSDTTRHKVGLCDHRTLGVTCCARGITEDIHCISLRYLQFEDLLILVSSNIQYFIKLKEVQSCIFALLSLFFCDFIKANQIFKRSAVIFIFQINKCFDSTLFDTHS